MVKVYLRPFWGERSAGRAADVSPDKFAVHSLQGPQALAPGAATKSSQDGLHFFGWPGRVGEGGLCARTTAVCAVSSISWTRGTTRTRSYAEASHSKRVGEVILLLRKLVKDLDDEVAEAEKAETTGQFDHQNFLKEVQCMFQSSQLPCHGADNAAMQSDRQDESKRRSRQMSLLISKQQAKATDRYLMPSGSPWLPGRSLPVVDSKH